MPWARSFCPFRAGGEWQGCGRGIAGGVKGIAGMCEGEWPYLFKKLFLRIFSRYNLALSEKKCNFVGDI